jgi:hypothetical protein
MLFRWDSVNIEGSFREEDSWVLREVGLEVFLQ